jgi:hypothetical protein
MGGLVLDIYVEFLIRAVIRFFKARGSASWPVTTAKVTAASLRRGLGCAVADIVYNYRFDGELYTGTDANPFLLTPSAESYLEDHPRGSELLLRVRPGSPNDSVVRQDDLYRHAHGYQLATK